MGLEVFWHSAKFILYDRFESICFYHIHCYCQRLSVSAFNRAFFGETDLSALEGLKGNFINYILFILMMQVVAAFGEEIFYRGYVTKRIAVILGNSKKGWIAGIVISSIIFGFAHLYQGGSGVITTGFIALIFGAIFYNNQQNLWVGIVTHGFYDVFGITMIYYGQERLISNWAIENIYFFL